LVPTPAPGDILVMDNLNSRKGDAIRAAIEAAGAEQRYLPPTALTRTRSSRPSPSSRRFFSPIACRNYLRNV